MAPLGHARVVVDHFHAIKLANTVVDQVRRRTQQARGVSELILLRCPLVLVDQSTQDVATTQLRKGRRTRWVTHRRYGRAQAEAAVRAVLVVVLDIGAQDVNKVRAADDQ
jgi:transposase